MHKAERRIADHVLEQAINWQVKLLSGTASPELYAACERWRAAAPEHNHAWQALQQLDGIFTHVAPHNNSRLVQQTLNQAQQRAGINRRQALKMLLIGSVIAPAAMTGYHYGFSTGGYTTVAGQQSQHQLPDGSVLLLNSSSAADVKVTGRGLLVLLHKGDMHIDTRARSSAAGIITVQSEDWHLLLGSGEYLFHQRNERVFAQALDGEMTATHTLLGQQQLTAPDDGWWLEHTGSRPYNEHFFDPSGWLNGALIARQMPLSHFLTELNRYRRGWLRSERQIEHLKVSGVFQLADTDNVLQAIAQTLPVKVTSLTSYLVTVSAS